MNQDKLGYLLTILIFILPVPVLIFSFSLNFNLNLIQIIILILFSLTGITISFWSVLYMKSIGGFYPFDIFNFKLGHKTRFLITDGPYGLCRNPMLAGFLIYHMGFLISFPTLSGLSVFIIEILLVICQVRCEEKNLLKAYGRDYEEYVFQTYRFLPFKRNNILRTDY